MGLWHHGPSERRWHIPAGCPKRTCENSSVLQVCQKVVQYSASETEGGVWVWSLDEPEGVQEATTLLPWHNQVFGLTKNRVFHRERLVCLM